LLQGELEWLQATLATLQEGHYLTVGKVEKRQGHQVLLDLAAGANSRCRHIRDILVELQVKLGFV
jgi:hypothetical protein